MHLVSRGVHRSCVHHATNSLNCSEQPSAAATGAICAAPLFALPTGTDVTPLVKGLPDDRCSAPHWGYVIKGQVRVIYADHQEVLRAGDLYYLPSGHTAIVEEDYEAVEFSPPAAHEQVLDVIRRNAAMAPTATS